MTDSLKSCWGRRMFILFPFAVFFSKACTQRHTSKRWMLVGRKIHLYLVFQPEPNYSQNICVATLFIVKGAEGDKMALTSRLPRHCSKQIGSCLQLYFSLKQIRHTILFNRVSFGPKYLNTLNTKMPLFVSVKQNLSCSLTFLKC